MGYLTEGNIIEKLLQLKEYYKTVRKNANYRSGEMDDCDNCKADHYLEARLDTIDKCIQVIKECDHK